MRLYQASLTLFTSSYYMVAHWLPQLYSYAVVLAGECVMVVLWLASLCLAAVRAEMFSSYHKYGRYSSFYPHDMLDGLERGDAARLGKLTAFVASAGGISLCVVLSLYPSECPEGSLILLLLLYYRPQLSRSHLLFFFSFPPSLHPSIHPHIHPTSPAHAHVWDCVYPCSRRPLTACSTQSP